MRERFQNRPRRDRGHGPRPRIRGDNNIFNRRGDNFHQRRRKFNNQRRQPNRPFNRREKLSQEKLNDELDNYFERKGGDSFKEYLDNDLEQYKNNAKMNPNLEKEKLEIPPKLEEKKDEQVVEQKVEESKKEQENKVEEKENKQEMEVEEKKVEKKKKGRTKK